MLHMLLAVRLLCARNVGTADRRLSHALVPGGKSRLANLPGILSNITGVDSYQDLIWRMKIGIYMGLWALRGF